MSEGGWGEGKRKRAGDDGKGKERKRGLSACHFPLPIVPRALSFFRLLQFLLLGYSAGASAEEGSNLTYSATISPIFLHLTLTSLLRKLS